MLDGYPLLCLSAASLQLNILRPHILSDGQKHQNYLTGMMKKVKKYHVLFLT